MKGYENFCNAPYITFIHTTEDFFLLSVELLWNLSKYRISASRSNQNK